MTWEAMFNALDEIVARVEIEHEASMAPWQIESLKHETLAIRAKWQSDRDGPVAPYLRDFLAWVRERHAQIKGKRNQDGRFDRRDDAFVKIIKALGGTVAATVHAPLPKVDPIAARTRAAESDVAKIAVRMAGNMRTRCIGTDIAVAIDSDYIEALLRKQKMRCAISDVAFKFDAREDGHRRNPFAPSIDRIVNRLGYVPGNVRITLVSVNIGINEWGAAHYREIAHAVVKKDSFEMEEALMTGYRFSSRPFHVWSPPDFSDLRDDALLTLEDACYLPELNQQFTAREIWQATAHGTLKSARPTGRLIFTTRIWVREWIESSCHGQESQRASISRRSTTSGSSGTDLTRSALASARNSTAKLRSGSKRT